MTIKKLLGAALAALLMTGSASAAVWKLHFNAKFPAYNDDLATYELTELKARVVTEDSVVSTREGDGFKVKKITGTRNGVEIVGLWKGDAGTFFGGWDPLQVILKDVEPAIPYDGIAYVTADGAVHVLYGATFDLGNGPEIQYWEMSNLPSASPYSPWLSMGSTKIKLKKHAK